MQEKSKKRLSVLLVLTLTLGLALSMGITANAAAGDTVLTFTLDQNAYTVNGEIKTMDTKAVSIEGRTMLPVRYVAEPLGAAVDWDPDTRKVTVQLQDTKMELWIGQSNAMINGVSTPIDPENPNVKPIIIDSRTMLPLRFVTEKLGCTVGWNPDTRVASITKPASGDTGAGEDDFGEPGAEIVIDENDDSGEGTIEEIPTPIDGTIMDDLEKEIASQESKFIGISKEMELSSIATSALKLNPELIKPVTQQVPIILMPATDEEEDTSSSGSSGRLPIIRRPRPSD
jgi:hypothetical protein